MLHELKFERYGTKFVVVAVHSEKHPGNVEITTFLGRLEKPGYLRERFDYLVPEEEFTSNFSEDYFFQLVFWDLTEHWEMIRMFNRNADPWNPDFGNIT